MEAVCVSETSVFTYKFALRYNLEDLNRRICRCENLESHIDETHAFRNLSTMAEYLYVYCRKPGLAGDLSVCVCVLHIYIYIYIYILL
jgi:hypothetical protein